jgi:hypothetical protein
VAQRIASKKALYEPLLGDEPLVVLPARALGHIEPQLEQLVRRLARLAEIPQDDALDELSIALARGLGVALVDARRPTRAPR